MTALKYGPKPLDCYSAPGEIGLAILRPDGTVFYTGSFSGPQGNGAGHTAIYYSAGPKAKVGSRARLPQRRQRRRLLRGARAERQCPRVRRQRRALRVEREDVHTGAQRVGCRPSDLVTDRPDHDARRLDGRALQSSSGSPNSSVGRWRSRTIRKCVALGKTYKIDVEAIQRLGQVMAQGDEEQNPTNYPLVRITTAANGNWSTTRERTTTAAWASPRGQSSSGTYFDVPKNHINGRRQTRGRRQRHRVEAGQDRGEYRSSVTFPSQYTALPSTCS